MKKHINLLPFNQSLPHPHIHTEAGWNDAHSLAACSPLTGSHDPFHFFRAVCGSRDFLWLRRSIYKFHIQFKHPKPQKKSWTLQWPLLFGNPKRFFVNPPAVQHRSRSAHQRYPAAASWLPSRRRSSGRDLAKGERSSQPGNKTNKKKHSAYSLLQGSLCFWEKNA